MKIFINRIFFLSLLSLALFSCEKDEERMVVTQGTAPVLSASLTSLTLDKADIDKNAITFSWTPVALNWSQPGYTYNNAQTYVLEIDSAGRSFTKATAVEIGTSTEKQFTVADFNALLTRLEFEPGATGQLEMRLKSVLGSNISPLYSNVLTLTATSYTDIKEYPSLYVPGNYQGWSPDKAPKVSAINADAAKVYEGYVNFTEASNKFKFTTAPNWDNINYGDGGTGKLSTTGGDLTVEGAGYYLLKVNLNDNTWSAVKTSWGVIGDATEKGWDSDQDMTYDATAKVWKTTLALNPGKIKFRANDGWDINMGDKNPVDGFLSYGGADIEIKEAGRYEIILNIDNPGNYSYSLKKL
jgi:hypothetical protein